MITGETKVKEIWAMMGEYGMGAMKFTLNDAKGIPLASVIAVHGASETREVMKAVEAIEESWNSPKPKKKKAHPHPESKDRTP